MMKILLWLLGMPKNSGSSGKREMAVMVALFTAGLTVWAWPTMGDPHKVTVLAWLISASVVMLAAAFGMEALITQAGFRFNSEAPSASMGFKAEISAGASTSSGEDELVTDDEPAPAPKRRRRATPKGD